MSIHSIIESKDAIFDKIDFHHGVDKEIYKFVPMMMFMIIN